MRKTQTAFDRFDNTMRKLMTVSHSDLKAKLDAEKAAKARKRKRQSKKTAEG
jgi:hypothetical protein